MSTKLVIYQAEDGKEIFRDFDAHFVPEKGMIVNFKETNKNTCNLMDKERVLSYSVSEIIFLIPNVMLVSVKMENNVQKFKQIEHVIADIMIKDGPDGHCDGSEKITEFIIALLDGNGEEWKREYRRLNEIEDEYWEG